MLIGLFGVRAVLELAYVAQDPTLLGSHGVIYTLAANAWLVGGNPWATGPEGAVFAGPPTMLLPFAPFAFAPVELTRAFWLVGMLVAAVWVVRRFRLSWYWLAFPPILSAVVLGHPEVLVLVLLTLRGRIGGPLAGVAAAIKPYAAGPLLAERSWRGLIVAAGIVLITIPILPWRPFLEQLPSITGIVAEQSRGDAVFGDPLLMGVAAAALLALGPRRALWLAIPVLWPAAQPIYKVVAVPAMSRLLALFWAVPIPGATLAGLVVEACVVVAGRRWRLPDLVRLGIEPIGLPSRPATMAA